MQIGTKMKYEITDHEREMLEAALNCMVLVAEAQLDDAGAEALYTIADSLADTFGIERVDTEVTDGVDQEGNPVTVVREVPKTPRFRISDASNNPDTDQD